ncbi:MAG: hypothetical protein ACUVWP_03025 [bacterium]
MKVYLIRLLNFHIDKRTLWLIITTIIIIFITNCGDGENDWISDLILISHHPIDAWAPCSLTTDGEYFYVIDRTYPGKILKISSNDAHKISDYSTPSIQPSGITYHNNYIWTTDDASMMIYKHNKDNMEVIETYKAPSENPSGICFDSNGNALICDWLSGCIYILDSNFNTIDVLYGPKYESNYTGITYYDDNIWICEELIGYIYQLNNDGEIIKKYRAPWHHPSGILISNNYLWVVDSSIRSLIKCEKP